MTSCVFLKNSRGERRLCRHVKAFRAVCEIISPPPFSWYQSRYYPYATRCGDELLFSKGVYLATSDNIQRLVVQGNSITETIEIARDVAKKLIEAQVWF